ncbi:MAG TPA: hypothetical protein VHS58_02055 [Acetobacteraceae bacterium]|jgi:hypothetical protein|nr:hypothetical protein [Acetobacteraceae bacterium]
MSKGPGRVERAIRAMIAAKRAAGWRYLTLSTAALCEAAFGGETWTTAQRVSVLRAMHRIAAKEAGWTTRRGGQGQGAHLLRFRWVEPPEPPQRERPLTTPEPIWAYVSQAGRRA